MNHALWENHMTLMNIRPAPGGIRKTPERDARRDDEFLAPLDRQSPVSP